MAGTEELRMRNNLPYPTPGPPGHMISNNMPYHYQQQVVGPAPPMSGMYPVHPDVKLKSLPFYELKGELLKPSSLIHYGVNRTQEQMFVFHLTPQQANDITMNRDTGPGSKSDYLIQVQMRFCLLETSCEQEDCFPPCITVKINNKTCPLPNPIPTNKPGVEPKRPPRPLNITPLVRLSPTVTNHISVSWASEYGRGYVVAVNLVKRLTSWQLLNKLKAKGVRNSDFTTGLIKEKLAEDADNEIATTSLRVSLMCPLGKVRMTTPCRPTTCSHLQCFDASSFLQMNERKPTWICPVCDKPALFDNLIIDGYFQDVLQCGRLSTDHNEIQLNQDGSWSTLAIKKESKTIPTTQVSQPDELSIVVDCDEPVIVPVEEKEKSTSVPTKKAIVVDLTLSDSDDDDRPNAATTPSISKKEEIFVQSDSNSNISTAGQSSASSRFLASPNIITLDSPSPPSTPPISAQETPLRTYPSYTLSAPPFFDLDLDSSNFIKSIDTFNDILK
uniref:SP-RING-type domain-containing protein n=1 Tax=Clastoptera arizonana TaxID=38151 RepID=A0A1B6C1A5_9HEMI